MMCSYIDLLDAMHSCPPGAPGWRLFEDACTALLNYLFIPPLGKPYLQARSYSGIDRRDAIYPNRQIDGQGAWGLIYKEHDVRLMLIEFKNYDSQEIGSDEIDQVRNYMRREMGKLALLCCNKEPSRTAHQRRNSVYSREDKIILFLLPSHLEEMCLMKERGEDPAYLIVDLYEAFYLQHE